MLIQSLEESRRNRVLSLTESMKSYSERLVRKGLPSLQNEISCYLGDVLFQIHKSKIIDYYLALSRATLLKMNNDFHSKSEFKYERCMTPHEDLIYRTLTRDHDLPVVRQLLIGGTHSDIYIPALHFCIEPSSERYFSTSHRARAETLSDLERVKMNQLWVWRTESFKTTKKDIDAFVFDQLMKRLPLSHLEIQNNYFSIACHTLPRFISYKTFCLLVKNQFPL